MPAGSDAYRAYLQDQSFLKHVLRHASDTSPAAEEIRRAGIVLVCAALQGFLRRLGQEHVEAISVSWSEMPPAQRMTVAASILGSLGSLLDAIPEVHSSKEAEKVAKRIEFLNGWIDIPGAYAKGGVDPSLSGFWDPGTAPKAIERFLGQLRTDGQGFFEWIGGQGADSGNLWATLEQVVKLRNDVAHGDRLLPSPTFAELRTYRARVHIVVRLALTFCRLEAQPDTANNATTEEAGSDSASSEAPAEE